MPNLLLKIALGRLCHMKGLVSNVVYLYIASRILFLILDLVSLPLSKYFFSKLKQKTCLQLKNLIPGIEDPRSHWSLFTSIFFNTSSTFGFAICKSCYKLRIVFQEYKISLILQKKIQSNINLKVTNKSTSLFIDL